MEKGHEIGYHTFDHVNLGVMSPATALMDYDKWYAALTQVLGTEYNVRFVRPPYDIISYTIGCALSGARTGRSDVFPWRRRST